MNRESDLRTAHLTDEQLFGLALPPAGSPEALPAHLSGCLRCRRALQEWKGAVAALAEEDEEAIARRPASEWRAAEERTLSAIRRAGRPGSRRRRLIALSLTAAAALLVAALLLPERVARKAAPAGLTEAAAELSDADRADDALLREAATLARGEDAAVWDALAGEPSESSPAAGKKTEL
jgi:hypothetical protein